MKQNEITAENGQPTTNTGEIILYQPDSSIRLEVRMEEETVWLTQSQMALLFGCSQDNIGFHLKNLYAEKEIEQEATTEEISVVRFEGNRKVTRRIIHYNLDAILSVGYRVSSKNAILGHRTAQPAVPACDRQGMRPLPRPLSHYRRHGLSPRCIAQGPGKEIVRVQQDGNRG